VSLSIAAVMGASSHMSLQPPDIQRLFCEIRQVELQKINSKFSAHAGVIYDKSAILGEAIKMGTLYVYSKLDDNEHLMAKHETTVPVD